jgi:hypothetical protein
MKVMPILRIAGQKFPRKFEGYLDFLQYFGNAIYLFNDFSPNPGWET